MALVTFALGGCGHPATHEECEAILNRSAEIELLAQNVTDTRVIAERVKAVRDARGDELIKQCIGKRITQSALDCVRSADSGKAIDACLQ